MPNTVSESNSAPSWNTIATSRRIGDSASSESALSRCAVDPYFAGVGTLEPVDVAQQHAFALATSAQNHNGFALHHFEVDAAQHALVAETFFDSAQRDERAPLMIVVVIHQIARKSLVRKKSEISTLIEAATTAEVVARPTPSAPPLAVSPLKHAMIPIR